jgi:hypothetical protein
MQQIAGIRNSLKRFPVLTAMRAQRYYLALLEDKDMIVRGDRASAVTRETRQAESPCVAFCHTKIPVPEANPVETVTR